MIAINFCVKQLNFGNRDYLKILFALYWNGLETKWLFEKGILSPWTYKNIVSVGLKLALYDQITRFISQYREKLPLSHREDFYQHAQAELLFAKADFQQVLRTTYNVQLKDAITRLRVWIIRIKACYELREITLLEYQIENLSQLLRREKRSAYHKQHYLDFVAHMSRLIRILPNATEAIKAFSEQLDSSEAYLERKWLKDKLEELES